MFENIEVGDEVVIDTTGDYRHPSRFVRGVVTSTTKTTLDVQGVFNDDSRSRAFRYVKRTGIIQGGTKRFDPLRLSTALNNGKRPDTWGGFYALKEELQKLKEKEEKIACVKRNIQQLTNEQLGVVCGWLTDKYKED